LSIKKVYPYFVFNLVQMIIPIS